MTFGVIVGNRGFFPDRLASEGREKLLQVLGRQGHEVVVLPADAGSQGSVETLSDAKACARLFEEHRDRIDGVIVSLPNFGDEKAVANTLRWAQLNVPVLVHAFPDELEGMQLGSRRDAFCGKLSVCNNLVQYEIPFSLTESHVLDPDTTQFADEVAWFAAVCRVVAGVRGARIGAVGARPAAFNTVRYSERILEAHGVSVETIDLADLLARARGLGAGEPKVREKVQALRNYCPAEGIPADALNQMGRLGVTLEDWIAENELQATAIQCWTALEEQFGIVPCAVMSMLSESLRPSACEVDVTGALSMYALQLAACRPVALVDWNNNYGQSDDTAVVFHCSNFPKSLLQSPCMGMQDIIAEDVGAENTYGTCTGRIKPGPMTFLRTSTDDQWGSIRCYLGEGVFTDAPLNSFGGLGVVRVPGLQQLLSYICRNGFEHHAALTHGRLSKALDEALERYLGWDVYLHSEEGGTGCAR